MRNNYHCQALILPGLGNSDPGHWQSLWEAANPSFLRVQQSNWNNPVCNEWMEALESSVVRTGPSTLLIAHSLGCLLVAHWAQMTNLTVHGALLVAPPNPDDPDFPANITGFSPLPAQPIPFPSILVASTNDPYGSFSFAQSCALTWGSRFVSAGAAGHINTSSGFGEWPEGLELLQQLAR